MKIAQIVCAYPPYAGGIGQVAFHFSRELGRRQDKLAVFTPRYNEQDRDYSHDGCEVFYLDAYAKWGKAAVMKLGKRLYGFDFVIFHYPFFGQDLSFAFIRAVSKSFPPYCLHYHMDTRHLAWPKRLFSVPSLAVKNSLLKNACFVSFASLDYLKHSPAARLYGNFKEKFFELPFGVDLDKYQYAPPQNGSSILFVGGLDKAHYFKGVDVLLEALARLPSRVKLRIVGQGELSEKYKKLRNSLGLKERVEFLGRLPENDLIGEYERADALVLPSVNSHEAFGLVLIEAMASGTPVVASDLPGVRKVFTSGQEGALARPGDPVSLARAVKYVLDADRLEMSRSARSLVESKYDWKAVGGRLKRLIDENINS